MTTLTLTDYPAQQLPDEVRTFFEPGARVDLIVRSREHVAEHTFEIRELFGAGKGLFRDEADIRLIWTS
jgi:hypothetical protein